MFVTVLAVAAALSFGAVAFAAEPAYADAELSAGKATILNTADDASGPELNKVMKRFPQYGELYEATNGKKLKKYLQEASLNATEENPAIVHATGTIKVNSVTIPENVILVGEKSTKYVYNGTGAQGSRAFLLNGSMFGGVVQGKTAYYAVTAYESKTNSVGGFIEDISVVSARMYGISIRNSSSGFKISNCKVSKVGDCGIQSVGGATIDYIEGCTITNVGESGIDVINANITTIKGNTIKGSGGHGISTDTDHSSSYRQQPNCYIGTIENNSVSGSVHHGIYLEDKCTVDLIKNTKVFSNTKVGICVLSGGQAKKIVGCKVYSNKDKNITVSGKNAVATLGANNDIYKSEYVGISVSDGGKLTLNGEKCAIRDNADKGVLVTGSGTFISTGKGLKITSNGKYGISLATGGVAKISNATFADNDSYYAVYVGTGCKFTYSNCNLSDDRYAKNPVYYA